MRTAQLARNLEIFRRFNAGDRARALAVEYKISVTTVYDTIHRCRRAQGLPPRIVPPPYQRITPDEITRREIADARREAVASPPFKGRVVMY
jgi:hypothetical protein